MKILIVSDIISPTLYEYMNVERFADIDLILSAGDLKSRYLTFLTTVLKKPLLYIHGNHDTHYDELPPLGCICIEDMVYDFEGLRIAGLGGCREYRGGKHQYTERAMDKKIRKNKKAFKKGFDILLTHSPAFGLGDGEDQAHIGFKGFIKLLDNYQPKYMIHGHQHLNYKQQERILNYNDTTIINGYGYYILDL
ncbi:metallophosphoesterase [Acidaminobacter sp. JC074]|uniref:metallophosphoesterase family protein n=1 Tax=Acidaminobacter sp. JC074 TaxID=2530199 RepID=UPI001F0D7BF2|nr:metallophosphoesterase [Acidaminobacter sp. JC074]MCH4890960.1 metallophosphoesterase [Acidaminobacter sp. JC074]